MPRLILPAAAALIAVSACAPVAPGAGASETAARTPRQCFDADRVQNFRADSSRVLYIRTQTNRVYALSPSAGCEELTDAMGIALLPGRGPQRLCEGDWTQVAIQGALSPGAAACRARIDRQLTEAEIEALPDRLRP